MQVTIKRASGFPVLKSEWVRGDTQAQLNFDTCVALYGEYRPGNHDEFSSKLAELNAEIKVELDMVLQDQRLSTRFLRDLHARFGPIQLNFEGKNDVAIFIACDELGTEALA